MRTKFFLLGLLVALVSGLLSVGKAEANEAPEADEIPKLVQPKKKQRLGLPPRSERTADERQAYFKQLRDLYERESSEWPAPTIDEGVEHVELGPLSELKMSSEREEASKRLPNNHPMVKLGKQLFFDPRLSGSSQIACASCHDPDLGWSDGRTTSFGHNRRQLKRNAPSIENIAFRKTLFWDGRAPTVEQQALDVLANADEMHSADDVLVDHLSDIPEYVESFLEVFGVEQPGPEQISLALAAYERTVVSSTTRFDRFTAGKFKSMTDEELSGLHLFRTDARCINCHNGPLLTDDKFHNIGISQYGRPHEDLGRYTITNNPEDVGAFRTPSLRNVTQTGPYMHSGLFALDELLMLYNAGMPNDRAREGHAAPTPIKSPLVKPLGLNARDLADITAFLKTLEGSRSRIFPPKLPVGLE